MTEEEQIEQLKKWLKENGLTIIGGIITALVIISGWHYWQSRQHAILSQASGIYDEMLIWRSQDKMDQATIRANNLINQYPKTPYAQMASFMLARDAVLKKNYPEATKQLNWVIDHSGDSSVRQIAKLRIARIDIADNKPDAALDTLKQVDDNTFRGLIAEVQGDAYTAMHDNTKAKASYTLALQQLPKDAASQRPILKMKIDNLG
jgi:predicted negative regulator of RcsB-dependent stress response